MGGAATVASTAAALPADPSETIELWPGIGPGAPTQLPVETLVERSTDPLVPDRAIHAIARPRLAVFRPGRPNGAALLVVPGGGYRHVVVDKEGYEFARWLMPHGVTVFVLFHRLPGEGWQNRTDVPLADAQRAMRLIRHRASDFAIDPARVSAMGFSAGGHVCADLAARSAVKVYAPVDAADAQSARPFCAAPIYPVMSMDAAIAHPGSRALLLGPSPTPELEAAHSPDRMVSPGMMPHFLLAAEDDNVVPVANTLALHTALRAAGVAVEMHLFAAGGHGFGLRGARGKPVEAWPSLWLAWAHSVRLT